MEDGIKVSVIIPVYNAEKYLHECLDSTCNQTLQEIEILCINDGSTDSSGEILNMYAKYDKRIKIFTQKNKGVSAARNVGLRNANGAYVAFVDSDDYIEADMLEKIYVAASKKNAEIVVFSGDVVPDVSSENKWILEYMDTKDEYYPDFDSKILFEKTGAIPFMCNKVYKRDFLRVNNLWLNETLVLGEDQAFQFSAFPCAQQILFMNNRFYHYRALHDGSAVYKYSQLEKEKCENHLNMLKAILDDWLCRGFLSKMNPDFSRWMLEFMYTDISRMRTINRLSICKKTIKLMAEYNLKQNWKNENDDFMYGYIKYFSRWYCYLYEVVKAGGRKVKRMVIKHA